MKLKYTDPKKKALQRLEIIFLAALLPVGLLYGSKAYTEWRSYNRAKEAYLAGVALSHSGNQEEALSKMREATSIYPRFYAAWEDLAVTYHLKNDHETERDVYLEASQKMPENGNIRRELACAYHELGMHDLELKEAETAEGLENTDQLFTWRVAERARGEASGKIPKDAKAPLEAQPLPAHDHNDGHDHEHDES